MIITIIIIDCVNATRDPKANCNNIIGSLLMLCCSSMFEKCKIQKRPKTFCIRKCKPSLKSREECSEFADTRDPLCYDTTP